MWWLVYLGGMAVLTGLAAWAQRRRRRGDEGDGTNARGAEAILHTPPGA